MHDICGMNTCLLNPGVIHTKSFLRSLKSSDDNDFVRTDLTWVWSADQGVEGSTASANHLGVWTPQHISLLSSTRSCGFSHLQVVALLLLSHRTALKSLALWELHKGCCTRVRLPYSISGSASSTYFPRRAANGPHLCVFRLELTLVFLTFLVVHAEQYKMPCPCTPFPLFQRPTPQRLCTGSQALKGFQKYMLSSDHFEDGCPCPCHLYLGKSHSVIQHAVGCIFSPTTKRDILHSLVSSHLAVSRA